MYEQSITTNHTSTYICIYLVYFIYSSTTKLGKYNREAKFNT